MTLSEQVEKLLIKNNIELTGSNQIQQIADTFWNAYSSNSKLNLDIWMKIQIKKGLIV